MIAFVIRRSSFVVGAFVIAAFILLSACAVAPPPANGWAIVAADPTTGDVGVAGASCSEYPLDYRAVLVPDKGAGVLLGVNSPLLRDRMETWIEQGVDAQTVVKRITSPENDLKPNQRQYGIVTIQKGKAQSGIYQRAVNSQAVQDSTGKVAVVTSELAQPNVAQKIIEAFQETAIGSLTLSDRLMRALETGSANGGASLCNQNGIHQTAATAFILVARGGDPAFFVKNLGNHSNQEPNPPWLAKSIRTVIGGENVIPKLREQYNLWRVGHLPPCEECLQTQGDLPAGQEIYRTETTLVRFARPLVAGFVIFIMLVTIAYLVIRPRVGRSVHSHS